MNQKLRHLRYKAGVVVCGVLLAAGTVVADDPVKAEDPVKAPATTEGTAAVDEGAAAVDEGAAAVDEGAAAVEVERPSWLTEAEQAFLDKDGLKPVATYDSEAGTVAIKLRKPGLTFDQVFAVAIGPKYDYYKKTALVETSFRGKYAGKDLLFTGTEAKSDHKFLSFASLFVPVVSAYTQSRKGDTLEIKWVKAGAEDAQSFMNASEAQLKESMVGAGVNKEVKDYLELVLEHLSRTETVVGKHSYNKKSGYYLYQQQVVMEGDIFQLASTSFGEGDIKGAALKVAYQVIGEGELAGQSGKNGPKVQAMDGSTLSPGK